MTRKAKVTWAEKAFQYPNELWRVRTIEGMVTLGKQRGSDCYSLHRFSDEGGYLTHISESEALWLTLELAPEKMDLIKEGNHA